MRLSATGRSTGQRQRRNAYLALQALNHQAHQARGGTIHLDRHTAEARGALRVPRGQSVGMFCPVAVYPPARPPSVDMIDVRPSNCARRTSNAENGCGWRTPIFAPVRRRPTTAVPDKGVRPCHWKTSWRQIARGGGRGRSLRIRQAIMHRCENPEDLPIRILDRLTPVCGPAHAPGTFQLNQPLRPPVSSAELLSGGSDGGCSFPGILVTLLPGKK